MQKNHNNKIFNNFKIFLTIYYITVFCVIMTGCGLQNRLPLTVTFVDISGALSADHTIQIKVGEEENFKDKYFDILIKSDTNVKLTIYKEFSASEDKINLSLNKNDGYVSLDEYKIFNLQKEQGDSMVGYGDVLTTNLVINSDKDASLTLIAKVGDKKDGKFEEIAQISKEYTLKVKKKTN